MSIEYTSGNRFQLNNEYVDETFIFNSQFSKNNARMGVSSIERKFETPYGLVEKRL